ncbi:MAG TPA: HEAT repeat domain-containing protein, partial [Planctomycetota bacterium]|nr:HEAT repeat domain-containing protein [Planctomycetota bacterium]
MTDAETGFPLKDARFYLGVAGTTDGQSGTGFQPEREVYRTDADGRFRVAGLVSQRYCLDAEAPGYLNFGGVAQEAYGLRTPLKDLRTLPMLRDLNRYWFPGWNEEHPAWHLLNVVFPETRSGQVTTVEICLRRGKLLRGRVQSESGTPLEAAIVEIERQSLDGYKHVDNAWYSRQLRPNRPTSTDPSGCFQITLHPALRARVRVSAPGSVAHRCVVDPLTFEGALEVVLRPGRILAGRVLTETGEEPDSELRLSVIELREGGAVVESTTDSEGVFSMDGVPPPPALVIASDQYMGGIAVPLASGNAPLELRLRSMRPIRGRVVRADGKPEPGAFIYQRALLHTSEGELQLDVPSSTPGVIRNSEGRLQAGISMYATCVAHSDAEGAFEMKTIFDQDGKVYLSASGRGFATADRMVRGWFDVRDDLVIRLSQREEPKVSAAAPAPSEPAAPRDRWTAILTGPDRKAAKQLIDELREAACRKSGGHPPTGESERPELIPVFVSALEGRDSEVQTQAIQALAYMNHVDAFEPLIGGLRHPNSTVRYYAVMGIGWMGRRPDHRDRAVSRLREILEQPDADFDVTLHAASSLVGLNALEDPTLFLRSLRLRQGTEALAASALAKLGRRDA